MSARFPRPGGTTSLDVETLHRQLTVFNHVRLTPGSHSNWREDAANELALLLLEDEFVEGELRRVQQRSAQVPRDPDAFIAWFEGLREHGPGQRDPLFAWLATEASLRAMRWFLEQEVAGEAGFEDLVALTQVKMPPRAKLELARNYWDEMGQGHERGMHGP